MRCSGRSEVQEGDRCRALPMFSLYCWPRPPRNGNVPTQLFDCRLRWWRRMVCAPVAVSKVFPFALDLPALFGLQI
jgi:hypothetical protein